MKVVIFAGGVGTRLWPLSRKHTPKQFEKIVGDRSTLQLAYDRVKPIFSPENIFISSGVKYRETLYDQLPDIPRENFILEPEMRDVGAAVGLVTAIFQKISPNEPFFILWSDHLVKKEAYFRSILQAANAVLEDKQDKIVFIGQRSRFASQNLGWIEYGERLKNINGIDLFEFKSLHYRPDMDHAETFHKSANHAWNPGYFGTTPNFLMGLYEKYAPQMHQGFKRIQEAWGTENYETVLNEVFPTFEKLAFDNLILEKLTPDDGFVIGADLGWSDIGAWEALKEALAPGEEDNVTRGKVMLESSSDSLVFNYNEQMVVGIDLKNFLIINTEDVLLICPKESVPKIKKLVESLSGTEHEDLT